MIRLVYPEPDHETYEASTFLVGSVSNARLLLDGKSVPLSNQGFFSWKIPLGPGKNTFQLQAIPKSGLEKVQETLDLTILRHPPKAALPPNTLAVDENTLMPCEPMTLIPGDLFSVACLATPGVQASVTIPGVLKEPVILLPNQSEGSPSSTYVDNRQGVFGELYQGDVLIPTEGYYAGLIQIPQSAQPVERVPIQLKLVHDNGETFTRSFPSSLSISSRTQTGRVALKNGQKTAIVRTGPSDQTARLTPQLDGVWLMLDAQVGPWYRTRLDQNETFWIHQADVEGQSTLPFARLPVRQIICRQVAPCRSEVVIPLSDKVPIQVRYANNELVISLYSTVSYCDVIRLDAGNPVISDIQWVQASENRLDVKLIAPDLSGYSYDYTDEGLVFSLKTLPKESSACVILIDPGHGGEETGTVGPNGLAEKDLNLTIAKELAEKLKNKGFKHVFLTRNQDESVSLIERHQKAQAVQADLVVSLHHNALPDGRDPLEHQGISCYYYHPFSQKLAMALQRTLSRSLSIHDYGMFYDSLAMTRIHGALSVLVEFGFFTNPNEFERLIEPSFQKKAVETLASEMDRFIRA